MDLLAADFADDKKGMDRTSKTTGLVASSTYSTPWATSPVETNANTTGSVGARPRCRVVRMMRPDMPTASKDVAKWLKKRAKGKKYKLVLWEVSPAVEEHFSYLEKDGKPLVS